MGPHDVTLTDANYFGLETEAAGAFAMDEDAFRSFYEGTARPLWAYLSRATGDRQAADDLLQECYYRLLRSHVTFESEAHRRHYLFRIATNLVQDRRRRPLREVPLDETCRPPGIAGDAVASAVVARRDVGRALQALRPRDRALL